MSYLLWHEAAPALASARRLFAPDELAELADVDALRAALTAEAELLAAERERTLSAARAEGSAAGLAEGRAAALDAVRAAWGQTLQALERARADELKLQRADVALLALQVARKLIGQLPEPERIARLADEAARGLLPAAAPLQLRLHPDHEEAVRALLGPVLAQGLTLRADAALPPDACRLSSALGEADAALETQLARIAAGWGITDRGTPAC